MDGLEFTLVIMGDSGVGKTSLMTRLHTDEFPHSHVPTRGASLRSHRIFTTVGSFCFRCWDCSGSETQDSALIQSHGAIVMFDLTSRLSLRSVPRWVHAVRRMRPHVPIVVVGNKADALDRFTVTAEQIESLCGEPLTYVDLSVKDACAEKAAEPFARLTRWFAQDESLEIIDPPAMNPPNPDTIPTAEQLAAELRSLDSLLHSWPDEDDDL